MLRCTLLAPYDGLNLGEVANISFSRRELWRRADVTSSANIPRGYRTE
jgi:hypothetical protein